MVAASTRVEKDPKEGTAIEQRQAARALGTWDQSVRLRKDGSHSFHLHICWHLHSSLSALVTVERIGHDDFLIIGNFQLNAPLVQGGDSIDTGMQAFWGLSSRARRAGQCCSSQLRPSCPPVHRIILSTDSHTGNTSKSSSPT